MKPVARHNVSKAKSASHFRHNVKTVASANVANAPMRGGWRL